MGYLLAFLTAVFFSLNSMFLKKGMKDSEKDNGVFMSIIVNVILFSGGWVIYRLMNHDLPAPTVLGVLLFVFAGICTTFLGRVTLFAGIRNIGPSRAVALKNSSPVFTLLFAIFILQESIGFWPWIGLLLIFAGLAIQGVQLFKQGNQLFNYLGFLLSILAAVSFGIGQGFRKQAMFYFPDPFTGALIGAIIALVSISIHEMTKGTFINTVKTNLRFQNKHYIISGVMTSFAVLSFFFSLKFIHVAYAGAIAAVEPVLTVILSSIFLKSEEKVSLTVVISAIFIFLGAGTIAFTG